MALQHSGLLYDKKTRPIDLESLSFLWRGFLFAFRFIMVFVTHLFDPFQQ